jgi:nitroreductase
MCSTSISTPTVRAMDVYEAIYTTRAMRRIAPTPLPSDLLPKLFDAAIRGPNSGNQQQFRFIVVTEREMKATIARHYRECLDLINATQYAALQASITEGDPNDPSVRQAGLNSASAVWLADHLHDVPALIFVFGKPGGETTTFPCLWNFCLAARAEGFATAITTLLKHHRDDVEALLGMPTDGVWTMHGMVPIGYPRGTWGVPSRRPAEEAVFAERWGQPVEWSVPEPLWPPT